MIRVKVTTTFPREPIIRQIPGSLGIWQGCEFIVNRPVEECDFWVIYEGLLEPEATRCAPEHVIFFAGEPPGIRHYRNKFLQQFGIIITSHQDGGHPCVRHHHQSQPWHVGFDKQTGLTNKTYDDLQSIKSFRKPKLLSVVCSSKAISAGHRLRLRFLEALKAHFGSDMDVYGTGFNAIADKWDAVFPYKYHVAMENTRVPHYFTEKITDSYLGWAYPLYYGCPNLGEYFPPESFRQFDISEPKKALKIIDDAISGNTYDDSQEHLRVARELVLEKYNLFAAIASLVHEYGSDSKAREIRLLPEVAFNPPASFLYRALIRPRAWLKRFAAK
jgi:hypothetical protein